MSPEGPKPAAPKPRLRRRVLGSLRLVWKLNGLFFLILVAVLGISAYLGNLDFERTELASAREASRATTDRIADRIRGLMLSHEAGTLPEVVVRMASENPAFHDIRLLAADGRVVASRRSADSARVDQGSWPCSVCHARDGVVRPATAASFDEVIATPDGERLVSVATPVLREEGCSSGDCHAEPGASSVLGMIQADFSLARVDRLIARRVRNTAFTIVGLLLLGTGATWWMTERLLGRRIRILREGAGRLAKHDLSFRFRDSTGDGIAHLVGVVNDVTTELSTTLTELTSAREHLQVIVENSADIIITVDPTGLITTFNAGAENVLGYARDEVIGRRIETLFANPSERDAAIAQLENTDHVVNYFTHFVTKDGEVRNVILTLSRLRAADGSAIGTMGISKDVTTELQLQRQLHRSKRMAALGQAITGIQHSIKNILNVMKGGAYLVRLGVEKERWELLDEGWTMVQHGIDDMTEMSMSMLDFARTRRLNLRTVDLAELAARVHRMNEPKFREAGVELLLAVCPGLPSVQCDGEMIRSVVMDLLSNALDACSWKKYARDESPHVRLAVEPADSDGHVQIEVRDNGEGMPDDVRKRVFTPFFSTKEKKGTGMGLAVVARIVNSHEGKTFVESEPGRGAAFRVVLPVGGPTLKEEENGG